MSSGGVVSKIQPVFSTTITVKRKGQIIAEEKEGKKGGK